MKKMLFFIKKILLVLLFSISTCFGMFSKVSDGVNYLKCYRSLVEQGVGIQELSNRDIRRHMPERLSRLERKWAPDVIRDIDLIHKNTDYRIVEKIRHGSEKVIFKTDNGHVLVLFFNVTDRRDKFQNEVLFFNKLNHENIMEIRGGDSGLFFYIQDFAEMDLFDYMNSIVRRHVKFDLKLMLKILKGIASGLEYLRQERVIHRDIKLENILLFSDGDGNYIPKITDFSFAIEIPEGEDRIKCNTLSGSFYEISPRCLREYASLRWRNYLCHLNNDIYSFGVLMYKIFYQQDPEIFFNEYYTKMRSVQDYRFFYIDVAYQGIRPPLNNMKALANVDMDRSDKHRIQSLINNLIDSCWKTDEAERPTPTQIIEVIDSIL